MEKNEQKNMQEKDLKAFLVTYMVVGKNEIMHNLVIVAFTKDEAGNFFIRWTKAKRLYNHIIAIVVQRTKKTKRNKHMFTMKFYEAQQTLINDLERKVAA